MRRPWLNSLLAFALAVTPAAAQEFMGSPGGFIREYFKENVNFQIVVLGGSTGGGLNAADPTLSTATVLGGAENDVIISGCYCTDTAAPATCAQTGPTGISVLVNNTAGNGRFTLYQTVVTNANKGTGITCTNPGSNSGGTTATQVLFRGVNPTSVTDATTVESNGTSTNPDPGAITIATAGAAVTVLCSSNVSDTTPGDVSGYATATPGRQTLNQADTSGGTTAQTWVLVAATGSTDPGAWNAWSSAAWRCYTVALRPWR